MRYLLLLIITAPYCYSQSWDIEREYLHKAFMRGDFTQEQYAKRGIELNHLVKEVGYPAIPLDSLGRLSYVFNSKNELSKTMAFKAIKEYIALNYGHIREVLHYEDFESGKIIIKGYNLLKHDIDILTLFNISVGLTPEIQVWHTIAFSVKDNAVRLSIPVVTLKYRRAGYTVGTIYIPTEDYEYNLRSFMPIGASKPSEWKTRFMILYQVNDALNETVRALFDYLTNYTEISRF